MIQAIRKNIGIIMAVVGSFLLCIITFGNLGDFATEEYWENVKANLTAISYMTIALAFIQIVIKQGLSEQALQRGLNTKETTKKYEEHRELIESCTERMVYMPYFLQVYNSRKTHLKKQEFIINNNYITEKNLLNSGKKRLIKKYNKIHVRITLSSIKWATTEIVYDKHGKIISLGAYKRKQLYWNIISAFVLMLGVSFLTKGLFFDLNDTIPIWQKFVKFFTYIFSAVFGSIMPIIKNYEKGAFSVPNELSEINLIWLEFKAWDVPDWVQKEIENTNITEGTNGEAKTSIDCGRNISAEQIQGEDINDNKADSILGDHGVNDSVFLSDDRELDRECNRDTESA